MNAMTPDATPDILCSDLVRIYRSREVEVQALQGLTLRVDRGEMVAVVGASGSGKSTLLGILSGLDEPSAGRAVVAGRDLTGLSSRQRTEFHRHAVGFVWQQTARNLLPFLSAAQNVAAALAVTGRLRGRRRAERVDEMLDLVGIPELRDRLPSELSGGQQQRVALAVAMSNAPSVLLADEPTGALDEDTSAEILETMRRVNESSGVTTLIVTHDQSVAEHVRRTVQIRDGRTSTEVVRRTTADGIAAEEFSVIDRVGRLQLPESFQERLGLRDRVRLTLETDRVEVRPGHDDDGSDAGAPRDGQDPA
jgi:ABC-type lipoprotein export system ATPase subunit